MSDISTTTAMEIADKIGSKDDDATTDIESQILTAMRKRITYLRDKADSFTFESVRRLLEEDLKLEIYDLDVHKSFIKKQLVQCLENADDNNETLENSQETEKKDDVTPMEEGKLSKGEKVKKHVKEDTTGDDDDEKTENSPVMGLLTEETASKSVAEEIKDEDSKEFMQSEIKRALHKRYSYIKANADKVTLGILRRLLEQDLKLGKYSLDPYKKYINEELDEVLGVRDAAKPSPKAQRKTLTKKAKSKTAKNSDSKEISDSDSDGEEEEVAVKKKTAQKRKSPMSEGTGKQKRENEKVASAKKAKQTDSLCASDAGDNPSSSEKSVKMQKQETATTVYGKRVERLKSVIKSCGMRKAKQAPEEKREDTLIKELKEILSKEGLSSNPSEKEIREVKKRKERTKELEGIDTSNIVSSSRRRSSTSFVPPPKPEKTEESESDESEDSEDEEDEEEDEGGNEDGREGSQYEGEPNTEDGDEDESE